tara:strand:+ start:290 stop:613 length:324 start_codon:yes stop_codon:yes gene_type:complete
MCLGGGGGYTPPPMKQAPAPQPGPTPPQDMVNNQAIPNANDRSAIQGNQNAMDPASTSSGSGSGTPNKDKMKLLTGKQHDSRMSLSPAYREAFQRGELSGQEGGINL